MALHGRKAQILLTSSPSLTMTNEALTDSGDHTTFTIPIASAAKRYWDRGASFTFETSTDGSTWNAAIPVSVRYINGQVTFSGAVGGTHQARVSGKYWPYSAFAQAREWTPDVSRDVKESTVMTTNTTPTLWRTFVGGLLEVTFKLSGWTVDDTFLNLVTSETVLIAGLVLDVTTGSRLDCEVFATKDSLKTMVDDIESEDIEFKINGPVYLTA
jgi:hypothetical protein